VGEGVSLADIMLAFSAHFVLVRGLGAKWSDDTYPNIKKWIRLLQGRDAWKKAAEQGEDSYTLDAATKDS
jgi:glutathione S-transferase